MKDPLPDGFVDPLPLTLFETHFGLSSLPAMRRRRARPHID